jgi:hypothetical protein
MPALVDEFIESIKLDTVQDYKNLQIYPLQSAMTDNLNIQSLDEALAVGAVEVTEVDDASVPHLRFMSRAAIPVIVIEGLIIEGNKQNRTVRHSFVLREGATEISEVYCVEAGRWHGRGQTGHTSKYHIYSSLRKLNLSKKSQQSDTWENIHERAVRMGSDSKTGAVNEIYQDYDSIIKEYTDAFTCKDKHIGMIAVVNGKSVVMDCFGIDGMFKKNFPKLISGVILDAIEEENAENQSNIDPCAFLKSVRDVHKERQESLGGAVEYRFETDRLVGSILSDKNKILHMEAISV